MTAVAITGIGEVCSGGEPVGAADLPGEIAQRIGRCERVSQLALVAGYRAVRDAGLLVREGGPRPGIGVALGTAFGCFLTNAIHQRRIAEGGPGAASPRAFSATVSNAAAGELAIALQLGGPNITLTAGIAGGLVALAHAADVVSRGQTAAMLTGGTDALGEPLARWLAEGGLGRRARPHGDGASILVLESEVASRGRAVVPYAWVIGWAVGFDPDEDGCAAIIERAVARAGVARDAIAIADEGIDDVDGLAPGPLLRLTRVIGALEPDGLAVVAAACPAGHRAAIVVRRPLDARARIH